MFHIIRSIIIDTMKEQQPDRLKWSFLRLSSFCWFWLGIIPATWNNIIYDKSISPEIAMISGVFFLGVVGGKGVSAYAANVQQGLNKIGGDKQC